MQPNSVKEAQEQITLDLQPEPSTPTMRLFQRVLLALMGLTNLIQGILQHTNFRYVNLVVGVVAIFFAFYYRRIYPPKVFMFDNDGFEGPLGRPDNIRLRWTDVTHIKEQMFTLTLFTKSGTEREIYLGNITFKQRKQIKPKIIDLARSKGIEIRAS